jgi:glutamine synthetase
VNEEPLESRSDEARRALGERLMREIDPTAFHFLDLQFTDVTGALKSVVLPSKQLRETVEYGHWFDGSAIEGAARMMETDLLLRPDLRTWAFLPWTGSGGERTARVLCDIRTPEGEPFPADPRAVLDRAVAAAAELGYSYHIASEVEFYLFGAVQPPGGSQQPARPAAHRGYFDLATDGESLTRQEMVRALDLLGVPVEASHHEIGPGQHEIDLPLLSAITAADAIVTCKYVAKSLARKRGLLATFMPKPLPDAAGSGLHLHQVLLNRDGTDAFADPTDEHGLSPVARSFIAGQLAHARALCAVLAPAVNSYKRIGQGFDAPSRLTWGHTNPLAVVRVPRTAAPLRSALGAAGRRNESHRPPPALRLELRCGDPSCNPYLALAAALAAGLEGIRSQMELPAAADAGQDADPVDEGHVELLPASLAEAIQELAWDPVIRDALGAPVYERLLTAKEQEWQEYRSQVSAWEIERYLESS